MIFFLPSYSLPTTFYQPLSTVYFLPSTSYRLLPTVYFLLPTLHLQFQHLAEQAAFRLEFSGGACFGDMTIL